MRRPSTAWVLANCRITDRDKLGRARKVRVKGGEDREYFVIIRRIDGKLSVECREDLGNIGDRPCQALLHGRMCYHARCAIALAAYDKGKWAQFHRNRPAGLGQRLFNKALPLYLFGRNEPSELVIVYDKKEKS